MIKRLLLLCLLLIAPVWAQTFEFDNSGNSLLNGQFRFREVIWQTDELGSNALVEANALWGTITFDGSGNYTISGQVFSGSTNQTQNLNLNGTYVISASGFGFIRRPDEFGGVIYGTISQGVFIGSATESQVNDLFIAAQGGGTPLTTATFNQSYTMAYVNLPSLQMSQLRDVMFSLQGNGVGALGTLNLSGIIATNGTIKTNQTITGSTYSFTGGVGTLNFNATAGPQILLAGSKEVYSSPDGAFIFGGSLTGFDMLVGIRTPTANVSPLVFDYLYYQAGIEVDRIDMEFGGPPLLDSYWGAFTPRGDDLIGHQRLLLAPDTQAFDFTYSDQVALNLNGTHTDYLGYRHALTADGRFQVGVGELDFLGIVVSVKAPVLQGPGVFLNPVGVVNAASFTPFTVGLSPGAVMTLYGTGIAETTVVDETFPVTLNGLQVRINGNLAPIYKTSPGEVSVVVPYDLGDPSGVVAEIQVFRNGVPSNRVTTFISNETPGFFTLDRNGLGYAAALHPDYSVVTPSNPARPGEIIAFFLSGLGATDPPVVAGTPAPADPLSRTTTTFDAVIDGQQATVHYSGLAPFLGGLYQLNVEIPAGTPEGDVFVEIQGPNSFNSQAQLPIGPGAQSAEVRAAREPAENGSPDRVRSRRASPSPTRVRPQSGRVR